MKTKIVILQTCVSGLNMCRAELKALGLREGVDFQLRQNVRRLGNPWTAENRQLFVTGSFGGFQRGVGEMVQELRKQYPMLVCMSFSSLKIGGPFDHRIKKDSNSIKNLRDAIKGFLDGKINRTVVEWTPSPLKEDELFIDT